ncbi:MAG: hypothetical protein QNK23_18875 [Crocinitomicaceae bacterium]|nr:hypothetical protein [Crocinitomicaceae bacterium]
MSIMLNKLLEWNKKNGDTGYDPYDVVSLNKFTRGLQKDFWELSFFKKIVRVCLEKTALISPKTLRKFLRIKKKEHPTHLGCMLHTYVNLQARGESDYSSEIELYRTKLIEQRSSFSEEYCWGVPFAWESGGVEFEEGTPFAVVANWIGIAFLELYKLNGKKEDLEIAISACEFVLKDLPRTSKEGRVCFSYSPLKKDTINNANLFAADLLIRVGDECDKAEYLEIGKRAVDFSIDTQLESGLIPYYAEGGNTFNDSYHSSYEMQCIYRAWKITGEDRFKISFDKYWEYYLTNYYHSDGTISKYSMKKYPVDSTSLADALILFAEIREDVNVKDYADAVLENLRLNWQSKEGYFYYKEKKRNSMVNIPYIRWTQGWMALGLSYWDE